MKKIKDSIIRLLSLAVRPGMDDSRKIAIQVATFDGLWTLLTILFYVGYTLYNNLAPLYYFHATGAVFEILGIWLLYKHRYDLGRYIIHITGLVEVFITADALGPGSGYEFYYFTSITIPFVTFSVEERSKGFFLSALASVFLIGQQLVGTGLILPAIAPASSDKLISIIVVVIFMVAVLSVARWQMVMTMKEIKKQQAELIHNSNLIALGEMSGGIAHEINNPLQTLSLQNASLRRFIEKNNVVPEKVELQLDTIDRTISKIALMIKGLKELSRDVSSDPIQTFQIKDVLNEVMNISGERLRYLGILVEIHNRSTGEVRGHIVHVSQVMINLFNNSIDAIANLPEKWIRIELDDGDEYLLISVSDSGKGIPAPIAQKIMQPFFTTKEPGKGTGLGLSISKSIIEKSGGRFYYDSKSINTKFVIELPIA